MLCRINRFRYSNLRLQYVNLIIRIKLCVHSQISEMRNKRILLYYGNEVWYMVLLSQEEYFFFEDFQANILHLEMEW